jgi:ferredoxin-nitrite reductase
VIKDKFRTGLNPQEKVKLEKEPMGLFMEDGIKELTKVPIKDIDAN